MNHTRIFALFCAVICVFGLCAGASAVEIDSGSTYCFGTGDFSAEELAGICITDLPDDLGALMLGSRVLREGDVLTAGQVAQMTLCSLDTETDRTLEVGYLPIYPGQVAGGEVMTISIRGKDNTAPVAEDSALETYKNLPNTGKLKAFDPENQPLTFTVTRQPRRGTVTISEDGSFTYTPKKNKVGVDSFVFTAADPAGKVSREATVTITIVKPTDSAQYTDTVGLSCRFAAEWMKNTGIFVGETLDGNPCFQPEKEVTRGEFLTMLVRTLELPLEKEQDLGAWQEDTPGWLRPYLASAVRSGLMAGLPEGERFDHETPITGAEAAVMIQNALALTADTEAAALEPVPDWAYPAMAALNAWGIPLEDAPLTRSQTANALYQVSKLVREAPGMVILNNRR